ncbi:uncharacterized protein LOC134079445 [Sardina pilchardus]|uniref:uncharacterized protein LOC134079445 n=1 Tax=Sardina pilchardus TaxID=27697 RepID=UPI002E1281C0
MKSWTRSAAPALNERLKLKVVSPDSQNGCMNGKEGQVCIASMAENKSPDEELDSHSSLDLYTAENMSEDSSSESTVPLVSTSSPPNTNTGPAAVLCIVCEKAAVKSCLTCPGSYCGNCIRQHHIISALREHKLVEPTAEVGKNKCQQHNRELEFFCKTDQTDICVVCLAKHNGHDIMTRDTDQDKMTPLCIRQLIEKSKQINKGSPRCYLLKTSKADIDKQSSVSKMTFGIRDNSKPTKTILIVGETGTGKTSLINTMVNYNLGIQWSDRVWFQITEDKKKSQAESQTSTITVYELFLDSHPSSLRIIDTPGYGATDGIQFDKKIADDLQVLFKSENGIHEIEAVGLVVKGSQNRLTPFQCYIFDAILSLFGKDIEKNIVVFSTHSDMVPTANLINALKEAKVPCAKDSNGELLLFTLNNRQNETYNEDQEDFFRRCWELGYKNMEKFFEVLEGFEKTELKMTKGVLRERKRLEASVYNLQEAIKMEELKQNMLKQTQKALEENKEKWENNEDFSYAVDEPYKELVPIDSSWWHLTKSATCCTRCEENCHYPGCWWVKKLYYCSVMEDGHCTVCTNKCPVSAHVKQKMIYESKTREVTKAARDLMQQYKKHVDAKKAFEKELKDTQAKKKKFLEEAYQCIMKLESIALKNDSFSTIDQLDFLIEKMRETGDAEKVKTLEKLNKQYEDSNKKRRGYLKIGLDKISECYSATRSYSSGKPTPGENPPSPHTNNSAEARMRKKTKREGKKEK